MEAEPSCCCTLAALWHCLPCPPLYLDVALCSPALPQPRADVRKQLSSFCPWDLKALHPCLPRWALGLQCQGSRNVLGALQKAIEVDFKDKGKHESQGIYLFTGGVPDQDVVSSLPPRHPLSFSLLRQVLPVCPGWPGTCLCKPG